MHTRARQSQECRMSQFEHLPPSGRGPVVILIAPQMAPSLDGRAAYLAAEGYVVRAVAAAELSAVVTAMASHPARLGQVAVIASGAASAPALELAERVASAAPILSDPP